MKRNYLNLISFLLLGVIIGIQSCKKDDVIEQQETPTITNEIHASGFIQKGPFVSGSQITIQELDNSLIPNGTTFQTVTNDDFGSFELNSTISTDYLEVISTGFYFNEVTGNLSDANLSLRVLCEVTDTAEINVNILTSLSKSRIEYLILEEGKTFVQASQQAETEILSIFNINTSNLLSFNHMDISQAGESNAILLAISVILQNGNSVAELSELISKISLDIKEDGIINDQNITQTILNNGKIVNLATIRKNIEDRYTSLGLTVDIPKFEDYIDSDGDGILNKDDSDQYIPIYLNQTLPWENWSDINGKTISFNNKLWIIENNIWSSVDGINWTNEGNAPSTNSAFYSAKIVYDNKIWLIAPNDIWNSSDGLNWTQISNNTLFGNTVFIRNTCTVFDNKIFVIADDQNYKVYSTTDGINWTNENSDNLWPNRNTGTTFVLDNKIWFCGGQSSIWNSADGITWTEVTTQNPFPTAFELSSVTLNNSVYIMSDYFGMWKSDNGIDYQFVNVDVPNPYRYVTYEFNDKFFVYGMNGSLFYMINYLDYSNNL